MSTNEIASTVAQKLIEEWTEKEKLLLGRLKFVREQIKTLKTVQKEIEANEQ